MRRTSAAKWHEGTNAEEVARQIRELPPDELTKLIALLPRLPRELSPESYLLRHREIDPVIKFAEGLVGVIGKMADDLLATAARETRAEGVLSILRTMPRKQREKLLALIEHRTEWAVRTS